MMNNTFARRCAISTSRQNGTNYLFNQNRIRSTFKRFMATAEVSDDSKLPLKGYRILDMTRVLAGVSQFPNELELY